MTRLFASDLHLDPSRPEVTLQFLRFLEGPAREAESLFLLGDLFEAWLGDDAPGPLGSTLADALAALASSGVGLFVMQGNRDFLIGERFCARAGATLLPDPTLITIQGEKVLLTHGDVLCTGDASYQRLRALVHDPEVQAAFLSLSLERRRSLASQARAGSRAHLARAEEYITDVSQQAVERVMADAGVRLMVHGHTHRPAVHRFRAGGRDCTRIVLGDWHEHGSVLRWDGNGYALEVLARA